MPGGQSFLDLKNASFLQVAPAHDSIQGEVPEPGIPQSLLVPCDDKRKGIILLQHESHIWLHVLPLAA